MSAWAKRELQVSLDSWQRYILEKALRYDRNGDLIHRTALWSTARQNGKSVIVRSFYGWLLDPEAGGAVPAFQSWEAITAAAHDAKQARVIYKGVYKDLKRIKRLTARDRVAHEAGERPPVYLTLQAGIQGERLTFDISTAEADASRSYSFGVVAWDEVLTQKTWDMFGALRPTQMMQRSAIMLLTSTAGFEYSVVLRDFYDRLKRQAVGDEKPDPTFYGAWWESTDPDAGLDWRQIRQANPSPRLPRDAVASEYRLFPADQWRRERLNHFIDVKADGAFNPGVWAACRVATPLDGLTGPYALAVDVKPGWERATISVAGIRTDGRVGVEVLHDLRDEPGSPVTAARVIAAIEAFPDYVAVIVFDSISGISAELRRRGLETGLPYTELTRGEFVAACMDVTEMIHAGRLAVDDPLLDAQMPFVARREVGADGAFCFSRGNSLGPIDAFLSMTFAAHGIASMGAVPGIV